MNKTKKGFLRLTVLMIVFNILITSAVDKGHKTSLSIGISSKLFRGVNINDAKASFEIYMKELAHDLKKRTGKIYDVKILGLENEAEIIRTVKEKKCDMISTTSIEYLKMKNQVDLFPALINLGNKVEESYIILAQSKSGIKSIKDIHNKKLIARSSFEGELGLMWLENLVLKNMKVKLEDCFSIIKRSDNQSQTILPVFFGKYDVCITKLKYYNEIINLNPQIGKKLVIIAKSPYLMQSVTSFTKKLSPEHYKEIINSSKLLKDSPKGKQILKIFQYPTLTDFSKSLLKNVEECLKENKRLKKKFLKK